MFRESQPCVRCVAFAFLQSSFLFRQLQVASWAPDSTCCCSSAAHRPLGVSTSVPLIISGPTQYWVLVLCLNSNWAPVIRWPTLVLGTGLRKHRVWQIFRRLVETQTHWGEGILKHDYQGCFSTWNYMRTPGSTDVLGATEISDRNCWLKKVLNLGYLICLGYLITSLMMCSWVIGYVWVSGNTERRTKPRLLRWLIFHWHHTTFFHFCLQYIVFNKETHRAPTVQVRRHVKTWQFMDLLLYV